MEYGAFVSLYTSLGKTTKKLEKTRLIADFLPRLKGQEDLVYLLRGRVFPDYDVRELGVSTQLVIKAIAKATGLTADEITTRFAKEGDLGDVACQLLTKRKQLSLVARADDAHIVLERLRSLAALEGSGTVDRKLSLISELLISSSPESARFIIRTLLGDLRVGVAEALLLDAIVMQFFENTKEVMGEKVKRAYDLLTDLALVLRMAFKGTRSFDKVQLVPGRPLNLMLAVKAESFEEAFRICGSPAAFEHKYDGFRVIISGTNKDIKLFTRRLEDVTSQFPDIIASVRSCVKASNFILDAEVVGYDRTTRAYLPFESISQRIKRKYHIDTLAKELPVEVNVFDVLYCDGENTVDLMFKERRALLEKIIVNTPFVFRLARQIITDDVKEAKRFYAEALKIGEEGIMVKNLSMPYKSGRAVGYMVKMKPQAADLDLVIVAGEYGTGKRAGGLTSFTLACRSNGDFVEVGNVSSGLKEKASEGISYGEINDLLQKLVINTDGSHVRVKPEVIVSVTYQNIQPSPTYTSGFALRFPRITHYRPDRSVKDIASLDDIKREVARTQRTGKRG